MTRGLLLAPLRERRFAQLLAGQFLSAVGDGAFLVGLVTVMVVGRGSARDLGIILGVRSLVGLLALVFGGVLADRVRRTRLMAATDTARAVLVAGVAFLPATAPLWLWIAAVALIGAASGLFSPAYQAVVPELVPAESLAAGNAWKVLTSRGALVLGPSLGALLVSTTGVRGVFLIDAASFGISLATLVGIREPARAAVVRGDPAREALAGVRAILDRPWIAWVITSGTLQVLLVLAPMTVMIPLVLHARGQDAIYGVVVGLRSAGTVVATVIAARWRPRRPGLAAMCGPLTMLALLACLVRPVPVAVILLAAFITGTGPALFIVYWPTALQQAIPEALRGRVFALDQLGAYTLQPVGLALAPLVVVAAGFGPVALAAGLVLIVTTFLPLVVPGVVTFATPSVRPHATVAA
jgi:MFS family permease